VRKVLTAMVVVLMATIPVMAASADSRGARSCASGQPLLFCEDFQSLPTGGATSLKWGVDTKHGTLTVEQERRGQKVLHVRTEGNGRAFLRVDDFAAPGNSFYGRVRVKVDAFPTAPDWAHFTLVEATGQGPEIVRPLGGQYAPPLNKVLWGVGADGGPTGDWTNWRESAPTRDDVWQCVEWRMDATDNRVELWFDGVAKPDLTVSTTNHGGNAVDFLFPRFDTVKLGWQLYQPNQGDHNLWMDDIALGTTRIGC
jgi:polysaccharide lyase-like protein